MGLFALAAASVVGGAIAANGAKGAANSANNANLQNTANTNAANLNLFNLSRGGINPDTGYGNAILPTYFGGNEQAFGQAAYNQFNQLNGQIPGIQSALGQYQGQLGGSLSSAAQALAGHYNGANLAQQLAYSQPLFDARLGQARAMGNGINTGFLQSVGQMNAQRAGQGFAGGSTFDNNRLGMALAGARSQAAGALAGARTQNAGDTAQFNLNDLAGRADVSPLAAFMNNAGSFYTSPLTSSANAFNAAASPMNFFRLQPQAFQNTPMPYQTPNISSGQIFGGALQGVANTGMGYYLNQGQQTGQPQWGNWFGGGGVTNSGTGVHE